MFHIVINVVLLLGLGLTVARIIARSRKQNKTKTPLLRIVPWTPTTMLSSKASPSGEVYPANNPYHSCTY